MARTYGSQKRLLLLSHAFHEKRVQQEEKSLIKYPNISSAIRPVPHCDGLPISEPCEEADLLSSDYAESSDESSISEPCTSRSVEFGNTTAEPHLINESELNDLVRDLNLPKVKAELLASD